MYGDVGNERFRDGHVGEWVVNGLSKAEDGRTERLEYVSHFHLAFELETSQVSSLDPVQDMHGLFRNQGCKFETSNRKASLMTSP